MQKLIDIFTSHHFTEEEAKKIAAALSYEDAIFVVYYAKLPSDIIEIGEMYV